MKLSIFSLKTQILLEFLRLRSKSFHSIIVDGKKRIFEKVMLCLNKGNIALSCCSIWCRMGLKRYFGCSFSKTLQKEQSAMNQRQS